MVTEIRGQMNNKCEIVPPGEVENIKCSGCNKTLLIVRHKRIFQDRMYSLVVECPFCMDKSFEYEVHGELAMIYPEGVKPLKQQENEKTKVITLPMVKG